MDNEDPKKWSFSARLTCGDLDFTNTFATSFSFHRHIFIRSVVIICWPVSNIKELLTAKTVDYSEQVGHFAFDYVGFRHISWVRGSLDKNVGLSFYQLVHHLIEIKNSGSGPFCFSSITDQKFLIGQYF